MKKIDLTGQRFGSLTVLNEAVERIRGRVAWMCQCECGDIVAVPSDSLRSGNSKSCGCRTGRFVDEVGNRHGKLTVIRQAQRRVRAAATKRERAPDASGSVLRGNALWVCRCDCGNEVTVLGSSLRSGNTLSCGCWHREKMLIAVALPFGIAGRNSAIANMKSNARRRDIEWRLTDDEVISLMTRECHYCGSGPAHTSKGRNGDFKYNGIDRVDNDKGYVEGNVVSCCITCNNAKRTLTVTEFLAWVERVHQHSVVRASAEDGEK